MRGSLRLLTRLYRKGADWLKHHQPKSLRKRPSIPAIPRLPIQDLSHPIPSTSNSTALMASRRLALNLTKGLRTRAARDVVSPLRRGFATPVVKNGVKTETTTLSNGLTVRPPSHWSSWHLLTRSRLPQNTRLGPRHRRWVCGLMLDPEQRPTERMAQLTSSNISPSRYDPIDSNGELDVTDDASRAQPSEHNTNWSWKLRTWVDT